jgi:hypothetical protein
MYTRHSIERHDERGINIQGLISIQTGQNIAEL